MIKLVFCTFLILISLATYADQSLYTTDSNQGYSVSGVTDLLKNYAASIKNKSRPKNLLFYVHGRGNHPMKGQESIAQIEKEQNLKVILFHWPAKSKWHVRPVKAAINASSDFKIFLDNINEYKSENPEVFKNIKVSILIHSMGTIILKDFIETFYEGNYPRDLFDTMTLNSSDTSTRGHKKWVERIDFSKNIVITTNKFDVVLMTSKILSLKKPRLSGPRLGTRIRRRFGFGYFPLAKNAIYYDYSKLSFYGHIHYKKNKYEESKILRNVYADLLNGKIVEPTTQNGVYKVKRKRIYFFKDKMIKKVKLKK